MAPRRMKQDGKGDALVNTKNALRPEDLSVGEIATPLPMFVRSVSSFENQLAPDAALEALFLIPNTDPLLISAFDFYLPDNANEAEKRRREEKIRLLNDLRDRGCFILMDSGNYEASRTGLDSQWTEEKYRKVLGEIPFTCAFSFDNLFPSKDLQENARDAVERVNRQEDERVLPIVHAPIHETGRDSEIIPDLLYNVAEQTRPHMIAIPERELGSGIFDRVNMVRRIRSKLNTLGFYQPLHILGTGNPISIVLFSYAGADSFDGLEWCRTSVDRETGLLYHHQQYDFFRQQTTSMARFETIRSAAGDKDLSLMLRMALHNLDFLYDWMEELRDNLRAGRVADMLSFYLPEHVYAEIRANLGAMGR